MPLATRLHSGATIGGKYRLEVRIARGGMGSVWRATHVELGVPVAIKFIEGSMSSSSTVAQGRFALEAKAAAGFRHPNIVDVRDYGVDEELPYLVMELLTGEDLGARLNRARRLSLPETALIMAQVARALRGAHEGGIVHRDLKPSNIFLARLDDEEVVKVLDFGIAKDTSAITGATGETTRTGELMGSPQFMSPEQVRGVKDLDARSDIWALGVIAFRCLTGRLPFHAEAIGAVIAQILADPIPVATGVAPDLPPEIDAFFARTLVRDRDARFASVREMATALSMIAGTPLPRDAMQSIPAIPMPSSRPIPPVADWGSAPRSGATPRPASYPALVPGSTPPPAGRSGAFTFGAPTPQPVSATGAPRPPAAAGDELTRPMPTPGGEMVPADLLAAPPSAPAPGTLTSTSLPPAAPRRGLPTSMIAGFGLAVVAGVAALVVLRARPVATPASTALAGSPVTSAAASRLPATAAPPPTAEAQRPSPAASASAPGAAADVAPPPAAPAAAGSDAAAPAPPPAHSAARPVRKSSLPPVGF